MAKIAKATTVNCSLAVTVASSYGSDVRELNETGGFARLRPSAHGLIVWLMGRIKRASPIAWLQYAV